MTIRARQAPKRPLGTPTISLAFSALALASSLSIDWSSELLSCVSNS